MEYELMMQTVRAIMEKVATITEWEAGITASDEG